LGIDPHCSCSSVLCTFRKQKMTSVLADSKVSDVKVTWWFWSKHVGLCTYIGDWSWRNACVVAVTIMSYGNIIMAVKCKIQLVEIIIFTNQQSWNQPDLAWPGPTCRIKGRAKARPGPMGATPLLRRYERRYKLSKMGWFGLVRVTQGH